MCVMPPQTISTLTWLSVFYLHREDEVVTLGGALAAHARLLLLLLLLLTTMQLQLEGLIVHALLQVLPLLLLFLS
jgi:hypothetical protein